MPILPDNFNRGDRVKAEWFAEIVQRLKRVEALRFNREHFNATDGANGRSVSLALTPKPLGASATSATAKVRYAHIVRVHETHPQKVMVPFLASTEDAEEGETGQGTTWSRSGDVRVAKVPPNFTAADFFELARQVFNVVAPVVRCDMVSGSWIVSLVPRWAVRKLPVGALITRCTE